MHLGLHAPKVPTPINTRWKGCQWRLCQISIRLTSTPWPLLVSFPLYQQQTALSLYFLSPTPLSVMITAKARPQKASHTGNSGQYKQYAKVEEIHTWRRNIGPEHLTIVDPPLEENEWQA